MCYRKRTGRPQTNELRPKRRACRRLKPRVDEVRFPAFQGGGGVYSWVVATTGEKRETRL